jgi:flagellum-specific peptidoglycan hydrolase FlgJ
MFGNVTLQNLFPTIRDNFVKFTSSIGNTISNTVSNLIHPDQLFISNNLPKGNNSPNLSFFDDSTELNKNIVGRSQSLASEKLKRVSPQQLKEAGMRDKTEFFKMLLPAALESERKYGVPASVTLAQAALESGWAKSPIGGYNIFGIKGTGPAGTVNVPTKEFLKGRYVTINDNFAKYNNFYEAVMKHGQVFQGDYKGYKNGLSTYAKTKNDYAFIDAVASTYATDPQYKQSIKQIMKDYDLVNMSKNYYIA